MSFGLITIVSFIQNGVLYQRFCYITKTVSVQTRLIRGKKLVTVHFIILLSSHIKSSYSVYIGVGRCP